MKINQIRKTQIPERSTSVDLTARGGLVSVCKGIKSEREEIEYFTVIAKL